MKHLLLGESVLLLLLPFTTWWNCFHCSPHNQLMDWLALGSIVNNPLWSPFPGLKVPWKSLIFIALSVYLIVSSLYIGALIPSLWLISPWVLHPVLGRHLVCLNGLCVPGPSTVSGTQSINGLNVNGFFYVTTDRNVNFQWSSGIGNSVCIWKLCSGNF